MSDTKETTQTESHSIISPVRDRLLIKPNWEKIENSKPPKENRMILYRIVFKDVGMPESIPTIGIGFQYADFDSVNMVYCGENHWRLDINRQYKDCPIVDVLYWAELEEIQMPDEFNDL